MQSQLTLQSKYSRGYWIGKSVKEVIDEHFYVFKNHINKYPSMYNEEVREYTQHINNSIRRNKKELFFKIS